MTAVEAESIARIAARLEDLHRDVGEAITWSDETDSELLYQVIMMEEVLAARWPRSILVRARWRRDVRESVRQMEGSSFLWRRLNTLGTGWMSRPGNAGGLRCGPHMSPPVPDEETSP